MKRNFRALIAFIKGLKKEVRFYWSAYDGNIEYDWVQSNYALPKNIMDLASSVVESLETEIYDSLFANCWSESDNYQLNFVLNPNENKFYLQLEVEEYTSEAETYTNILTNPELEEYFKRTGVEFIEARYSGGGDSGDIDNVRIDGEDTNIQWGPSSPDEKLIWETLYVNLENAYGGWEIDDGSAGTIELSRNMEIIISHEWNMRDWEFCGEILEITTDTFDN